jgi:hypothetical protein
MRPSSRAPATGAALRSFLVSCGLFVLLAPARSDAAPAAGGADADKAEVEAYRLTTATLAKVEKAYTAFAEAAGANPALREKLEDLDPMEILEDEAPSLARSVALVESVPEYEKAVADAGLAPREFVVFGYALAGTMFAAAFGAPTEPEPGVPPALAENVRWYEANRDAVDRFQARMERLFPDDDDEAAIDDGAEAEEEMPDDADSTSVEE